MNVFNPTPIATSTLVGTVKPDNTTTTVDPDGTLHAAGAGASASYIIMDADKGRSDDIHDLPSIPTKDVLGGFGFFAGAPLKNNECIGVSPWQTDMLFINGDPRTSIQCEYPPTNN